MFIEGQELAFNLKVYVSELKQNSMGASDRPGCP